MGGQSRVSRRLTWRGGVPHNPASHVNGRHPWSRLAPGPPHEGFAKGEWALDLDVWLTSDAGIMYEQQKKGRLLQYVSPQMKEYAPELKSGPEGYWTTYFINAGPITGFK